MSDCCDSENKICNSVADIAQEILLEMDGLSGISEPYLISWLRANIGLLNTAIGTKFVINSETLEFCPAIQEDQKSLLKWMFSCTYWERIARSNLGASGYSVQSVEEGDSKIRLTSKTDVAKAATALAKDCRESLKQMILYYKTNKALPRSLSSATSPMWQYPRVSDPHQNESFPYYYGLPPNNFIF